MQRVCRVKHFFYPLIIVIAFVFAGEAYEEWSLPGLTAPTSLVPLPLEVKIQHQFWGRINGDKAFSRFFGISDGATMEIETRLLMRGSRDGFVRLGFQIKRLFTTW